MTTPDFDQLAGGDDLTPEERERLLRAHELLVAAGPLPELPPQLETLRPPEPAEVVPFFNQRRSAVYAIAAAAVAALAFGGGYLTGNRNAAFAAVKTVRLQGTKAAPDALGVVKVGKKDGEGNWPMEVTTSNLPNLPPRGYYTVWLTRKGKPVVVCGTFRAHGNTTSVRFNVAYTLDRFDGWVVTKWVPHTHGAGPTMLAEKRA